MSIVRGNWRNSASDEAKGAAAGENGLGRLFWWPGRGTAQTPSTKIKHYTTRVNDIYLRVQFSLSELGGTLRTVDWRAIREKLGLKLSCSKAAQKLRSAIESGELSVTTSLKSDAVERVLGFDSLDKVELVMGCEELGMSPQTVGELIGLLELMDRNEPSDIFKDPPGPPPMHPLPVVGPVESTGVKDPAVPGRKAQFEIRCGPLNLSEAIELFVQWFNSGV